MSKPVETIDLRDGYRIEVAPMVLPQGSFGARLHKRIRNPATGHVRWKPVGPIVVSARGPEQAERDMSQAINLGLLEGVEAKG
jgi:hypothetical protein